jgi:hypothetical protein
MIRLRLPRFNTDEAAGLDKFTRNEVIGEPSVLASSVVEALNAIPDIKFMFHELERARVPSVTLTAPLNRLEPVNVRVEEPALMRDEPKDPEKTPAKVEGVVVVRVSSFVPRATVDEEKALERLFTVALVVTPEMSNVLLPESVKLLDEAIAPDPERARVPPKIVVGPVRVLVPDRASVPAPAFSNAPAPETTDERVEVPVAVLTVPVLPPSIEISRSKSAIADVKMSDPFVPKKRIELVEARGVRLATAIDPLKIRV